MRRVDRPQVRSSMAEALYVDPESAVAEIKRRWTDKGLEKRVSDYLGGDIPCILGDGPKILLFRHLVTPDEESRIAIELAKKHDIDVVFFEYTQDRFTSLNFDKYTLVKMFFLLEKKGAGKDRVVKINVADMNSANGRRISSIDTKWGKPLVDFHHSLFAEVFPEYTTKLFDASQWLKTHGERAALYYDSILCLTLRNCILLEDFHDEGDESEFTHSIILPAFRRIEAQFGLKPLIVKLAPEDSHIDPTWWYYRAHIRDVVYKQMNEMKLTFEEGLSHSDI